MHYTITLGQLTLFFVSGTTRAEADKCARIARRNGNAGVSIRERNTAPEKGGLTPARIAEIIRA